MSDDVDADEGFDPRRWYQTITYAEAHAAIIGATLAFLAAIASSPEILTTALAILLWALGIRSSPHRQTRTGDKRSKDSDDESETEDRDQTMVRTLLSQIRREVHYYIGGLVVGDRVGWLAHRAIEGTGPDHYEEIGRIIETLVAGGIA